MKDRICRKVVIRTTSRLAVIHTNSVNGKMYKTDILELKVDKTRPNSWGVGIFCRGWCIHCQCLGCWAAPGVLWKKAAGAMRAMRANALETV